MQRKRKRIGRKRKMISWLTSLFSKKKVKKYKKLTAEEKRNVVTDSFINKMSRKDIASKYGCSIDTVRRLINAARRVQ